MLDVCQRRYTIYLNHYDKLMLFNLCIYIIGYINCCLFHQVMYNAASIAESLRDAKNYGFDIDIKGFNWQHLKSKRDSYIKRLNGIYQSNMEKDAISIIKGEARFIDQKTVCCNGQSYTAKHILIATGSTGTHATDIYLTIVYNYTYYYYTYYCTYCTYYLLINQ